MAQRKASIWWGPPRKFDPHIDQRRVSWLELFYDLVYVIAISRITHHLAEHPDFKGILHYLFLFIMIFWGWMNGSLYYDLHGSPGIRTRLMTMWQMVAIAALIVCLNIPSPAMALRTTIALIVLQLYITYLWLSVGFYDPAHRKYNKPYTICFLISAGLLATSLFIPEFRKPLYWAAAILNLLPPFLAVPVLRKHGQDFSMSESMTERLGLFTIIIFGEGVLGVVQGTINAQHLDTTVWINFGLGILIVFALWWVFFAALADREPKPGFLVSNLISIGYIPTLAALGMVGAAFSGILESATGHGHHHEEVSRIYGVSLAVFLFGIAFISRYFHYPPLYAQYQPWVQRILVLVGCCVIAFTFLQSIIGLQLFLILVLLLLILLITVFTRIWFCAEIQNR
jgi:low temperature requirement protein LtrA